MGCVPASRVKGNSRTGSIVIMLLVSLLLFFGKTSRSSQEVPIILPAPVISSANFPCSQCHTDDSPGMDRRTETFHASIRADSHIEEEYDCFGCHDKERMDRLRLFNGGRIELIRSSELCGQCHSTNYTLWESGLHGKVSGPWNGPRRIAPCTSCHDPHQPGFLALRPAPPPVPPEETLRWGK